MHMHTQGVLLVQNEVQMPKNLKLEFGVLKNCCNMYQIEIKLKKNVEFCMQTYTYMRQMWYVRS